MMSNIDKAGEVLEGYFPPCEKCRGLPDLEVGQCQDCAESVVHIARDLDAAGLLAPDLPAPSLYACEDQDKPMWDTCNYFRTDALDAPQVALSKAGYVWKMTPDEARALALALLAAADHAEKDNQ